MSDIVTLQNMSFKVGQTMTITGVPTIDSTGFDIYIGHSEEEVALCIAVRFDELGDQRKVVYNSYQGGSWGQEFKDGRFPFNQGKDFKIKITFTSVEFTIFLPDGSRIHFPNRFCATKYKFFQFKNKVTIHGIEIK